MYLIASVRPSVSQSAAVGLGAQCNQWAYANSREDAVDRLLIQCVFSD